MTSRPPKVRGFICLQKWPWSAWRCWTSPKPLTFGSGNRGKVFVSWLLHCIFHTLLLSYCCISSPVEGKSAWLLNGKLSSPIGCLWEILLPQFIFAEILWNVISGSHGYRKPWRWNPRRLLIIVALLSSRIFLLPIICLFFMFLAKVLRWL